MAPLNAELVIRMSQLTCNSGKICTSENQNVHQVQMFLNRVSHYYNDSDMLVQLETQMQHITSCM